MSDYGMDDQRSKSVNIFIFNKGYLFLFFVSTTRAEIREIIFISFLGELKTPQFPSEIS